MLSQRLSLLVKAKGLTQKSIADKMGVSEQALSRYLLGKTAIGADSLEVLLSCLGINVEKLVDAEIAKTMKTQEKRSARRTLTEAFRQLEGAIYFRTSGSPALSKEPARNRARAWHHARRTLLLPRSPRSSLPDPPRCKRRLFAYG